MGSVVQRPISANPGLNFNPVSYISLFKSCFGIIFPITMEHSVINLTVHKKNQIVFSFKVLRSEIKIHINSGLS